MLTVIKPMILGALVLLISGNFVAAEEVAVLVDNLKPGTYLVEVKADGTVTANPIKSIRPGSVSPPVTPIPPTEGTLASAATRLTQQAIASGGTTDTAGLLAMVYSTVGAEIDNGVVAPENAAARLKAFTDAALSIRSDADKWGAWRTGMSELLSPRVGTKDQWVSTLKQLSEGTKIAAEGGASSVGKAIDWDMILTLIKLILELLASRQ